jgi:hypothetical protein
MVSPQPHCDSNSIRRNNRSATNWGVDSRAIRAKFYRPLAAMLAWLSVSIGLGPVISAQEVLYPLPSPQNSSGPMLTPQFTPQQFSAPLSSSEPSYCA